MAQFASHFLDVGFQSGIPPAVSKVYEFSAPADTKVGKSSHNWYHINYMKEMNTSFICTDCGGKPHVFNKTKYI
jgi:hypothetical protein